MALRESAAAFYQRHDMDYAAAGQFNVYRIEDHNRHSSSPHSRKDFYKVMLTTKANGLMLYAGKTIPVKGSTLIFANPMVPYSWERLSGSETGFFCVFTDDFIHHHSRTGSAANAPLFKPGAEPILFPDPKTTKLISSIFGQMLEEIQSPYLNKYDLLHHYVQILFHQALKIAPSDVSYQQGTAAIRISSLFLELLERQFPVSSPLYPPQLSNPHDFAAQLQVHTNHLNKALKEATGKTTTEHITGRLLNEAKALLTHSNWTVAEIGYALNFDHPSNFNIFFKKHTGQTLNHFRQEKNSGS